MAEGNGREAVFSFNNSINNSTAQGEIVKEIYRSPERQRRESKTERDVPSTKYNSISKRDRRKSEAFDLGSFEVNCQIKTIHEGSATEATYEPSSYGN